MAIDDGTAVSYTVLPTGIPVYSSDEIELGTVRKVLDNAREHIFDGIVMDAKDGRRIFVDAPEVARTAERAVTLNITAEQASDLPPYSDGGGIADKARGGLLGKLFGR
jgi:hypothetical protein